MTSRLSAKIRQKINDKVSAVFQLGGLTEAEVVNLDPTASKNDVLKALRNVVPAIILDAKMKATFVSITGLWVTRAGNQVTSACMSNRLLHVLDRVSIGWIVTKVWEKTPEVT